MSILNEFKEYMDSDGLVHPLKNPQRGHTQNGIRWSSEAAACVRFHPDTKLLDYIELRTWFLETINKCRVPGYIGLYDRTPTRPGDQEGPDDYMCLTGACFILVIQSIPKEILDYGRSQTYRLKDMVLHKDGPYYKIIRTLQILFGWVKVRYNLNNKEPNVLTESSWFGRFPALICALKYAAGEKPTAFEKFWMFGCLTVMVLNNDKKGQDGWVLQWFLNQPIKGKHWYLDLAIRFWEKKLKQRHADGVRGVLNEYFNNPEYPTCKYFPG